MAAVAPRGLLAWGRMGRSRLTWAVGVIAPWCLGLGLVVSFTADAGQDASIGATLAPIASRAPSAPLDLIPATSWERRPFGLGRLPADAISLASLAIGEAEDLKVASDEVDPRADLKANVSQFPVLDRSHQGDPVVGLRPTFETRLRGPGGLARWQAAELMFNSKEYLAFDGFAQARGDAPGPDAVASFEPYERAAGATQPAEGSASPGASGSAPTLRMATATPRTRDGSTPAVPRAVALASASPAAINQIPVQIFAATGARVAALPAAAPRPTITAVARTAHPDYASLIERDRGREEKCLAEAIYFESRSESEEGQAAVAQVVLNRVGSGLYPASICAVVYQNRHQHNACQFSFACDGRTLRVNEPDAWRIATRIAREVLDGKTYVSDVGSSTHYHASYVRPYWAKALKKMDKIGTHIFYKLRPGQT